MSERVTRRSDAETARANGWKVGTVVRGHEQWADGVGVWSTWRITAIGEECVLVRTIRREFTGKGVDRPDDLRLGPEHTATFKMRNWVEVVTTPPTNDSAAVAVERDLWWGYLCPALANIGALKQAQSDLVALGADWAEVGRVLSRVQSFYVNAAHEAAQRYLVDLAPAVETSEREGR